MPVFLSMDMFRAFGVLLALAALHWLLLFFSSPCAAAVSPDPTRPDILLLHSYHQGLEWTDSVTAGVQEELGKALPGASLSVEYMDTKRYTDKAYYDRLLNLYRYKYARQSFDALIASDDNAFNFILQHRNELFPDVPLVFCGVNRADIPDLRTMPRITGVTQHPDMAGTLEAALSLHPDTRTVYVVNDDTVTGRAMENFLRSAMPAFQDRVTFEFPHAADMESLLDTVRSLPPDSVVLLLSFARDAAGNLFGYGESCRLLHDACPRPIYALWSVYLGHGIIGGQLNSGRLQGNLAVRQALKLLTSSQRVPILLDKPNRFYFDAGELQRFNVEESALPPGSIVTNRPPSLYKEYKSTFWFVGTLLMLAAAFGTVLTLNIGARRRETNSKLLAERRFHEIFENAAEGIFLCSREGNIINANQALALLLDYDDPATLSETVVDIRSQVFNRQSAWDDILNLLGKQGRIHGFETRLKSRKGAPVWVIISARISDSQTYGGTIVEGFVTDISSQKATERELEQLNHNLEDKVEARTADLRTKALELERANERLLELDGLKSSFLTTVSHDLRTPLTSIMGFVKLTMRDIDKVLPATGGVTATGISRDQQRVRERIATNLEIVSREGERLTRLINDFLDLSKIESGQANWNDEPCDIADIVRESLDAVAGYAKEKPEVDLKHGLAGGLPKVKVDRDRMVQVLVNLLSNALKFTEEGEVTLTAWQENSSVRIQVKDSGLGIAPEDLDRIFDRFFQADSDTLVLARPKGTGMGLVICREILQHYNGRIWAESVGEGSTFHVELPANSSGNGTS